LSGENAAAAATSSSAAHAKKQNYYECYDNRQGGEKVEFFETVKKRQSIRAYEKKDIGPTILRKMLETANAAPSAGD
jgi:hypothetical protein